MPAAPATPAISTKQTLQNAALKGWRSKRAFAFVLLAFAVAIGAYLRFGHLTLASMDGDEGYSWAVATSPDVSQVIRTGLSDAGKLPLYYALLHGWIALFGDSVLAMRSLSAGLGTISIVFVFVAVREVCLCLSENPTDGVAELAGAFSALIFASDVRMVMASRLVRMYPMMQAFAFLQIAFFVRAQRHGKLSNYAGIAVFTMLMVATNLTASFLLIAEGVWLAGLLLAKWRSPRAARLEIFRPGFAVLTGLALLVPVLLVGIARSWSHSIKSGFFSWIKLKPITWPYKVLYNSARSHALFWIFVVLAAVGVWKQWRGSKLIPGFMGLWIAGPLIAVMGVTYLFHPMEVPRYVLVALVGFFALAALGAASLESTIVRIALVALIGFMASDATYAMITHPNVPDWRAAVEFAAQRLAPSEGVAVIPSYEANTVRYYLPPSRRDAAGGLDFGCGSERFLLFSDWWWLPAKEVERAKTCYPRVVKRLFRVEIRSRG